MRILKLFFCLTKTPSFIKNQNYPVCAQCVSYLPVDKLSKCKTFGQKDFLTGKILYDYADFCREDEMKCGLKGKYFVPKHSIFEEDERDKYDGIRD